MIFIATDHAAFELKKKINQFLRKENLKIADLGPRKLEPLDDYPDYGFLLAKEVVENKGSQGILLCRSGAGMGIVANKVKGIRAAVCLSELQAQKARKHNDANVLVLAADFTSFAEMKKVIKKFLDTRFSNEERHARRLKKIEKYEKGVV